MWNCVSSGCNKDCKTFGQCCGYTLYISWESYQKCQRGISRLLQHVVVFLNRNCVNFAIRFTFLPGDGAARHEGRQARCAAAESGRIFPGRCLNNKRHRIQGWGWGTTPHTHMHIHTDAPQPFTTFHKYPSGGSVPSLSLSLTPSLSFPIFPGVSWLE